MGGGQVWRDINILIDSWKWSYRKRTDDFTIILIKYRKHLHGNSEFTLSDSKTSWQSECTLHFIPTKKIKVYRFLENPAKDDEASHLELLLLLLLQKHITRMGLGRKSWHRFLELLWLTTPTMKGSCFPHWTTQLKDLIKLAKISWKPVSNTSGQLKTGVVNLRKRCSKEKDITHFLRVEDL